MVNECEDVSCKYNKDGLCKKPGIKLTNLHVCDDYEYFFSWTPSKWERGIAKNERDMQIIRYLRSQSLKVKLAMLEHIDDRIPIEDLADIYRLSESELKDHLLYIVSQGWF